MKTIIICKTKTMMYDTKWDSIVTGMHREPTSALHHYTRALRCAIGEGYTWSEASWGTLPRHFTSTPINSIENALYAQQYIQSPTGQGKLHWLTGLPHPQHQGITAKNSEVYSAYLSSACTLVVIILHHSAHEATHLSSGCIDSSFNCSKEAQCDLQKNCEVHLCEISRLVKPHTESLFHQHIQQPSTQNQHFSHPPMTG